MASEFFNNSWLSSFELKKIHSAAHEIGAQISRNIQEGVVTIAEKNHRQKRALGHKVKKVKGGGGEGSWIL